jgi:hypothetical protein
MIVSDTQNFTHGCIYEKCSIYNVTMPGLKYRMTTICCRLSDLSPLDKSCYLFIIDQESFVLHICGKFKQGQDISLFLITLLVRVFGNDDKTGSSVAECIKVVD